MQIGLFADTHDHLDRLRQAVALFNQRGCDLVLFAGDLVSTFAVPPLRQLHAPLVACYGDNEGNKIGLQAGFSIIGPLGETSGWTYGRPSVALLDTTTRQAEIIWLATEEKKFDG